MLGGELLDTANRETPSCGLLWKPGWMPFSSARRRVGATSKAKSSGFALRHRASAAASSAPPGGPASVQERSRCPSRASSKSPVTGSSFRPSQSHECGRRVPKNSNGSWLRAWATSFAWIVARTGEQRVTPDAVDMEVRVDERRHVRHLRTRTPRAVPGSSAQPSAREARMAAPRSCGRDRSPCRTRRGRRRARRAQRCRRNAHPRARDVPQELRVLDHDRAVVEQPHLHDSSAFRTATSCARARRGAPRSAPACSRRSRRRS